MNLTSKKSVAVFGPMLFLLLSACTNFGGIESNILATNELAYYPPDLQTIHQTVFDEVWQTIDTEYIRDDFGGTDWAAVKDEYGPLVETAASPADFQLLMEEMVAEIPNSGIQVVARQTRIDQSINRPTSINGVGPYLAVRDGQEDETRLIVMHVLPGSPAAAAGLQPHDAILLIDGEEVGIEGGPDALQRLSGPEGSTLQLLVRSPEQEPRFVNIVRESVRSQPSELRSYIIPGTNVLYLQFPPHEARSIINEFAASIERLSNENVSASGIVIDLRVMIGRNRSAITQLLPVFTDGEVIIRNERGELRTIDIAGLSGGLQETPPLVLLVGPETAGAAEIFAAALQDSGRAYVIGQPTRGVVEEFESTFLANGSQLVMPTSTFILPSNERDLGVSGIEPDLLLDLSWDEITSSDDPFIDEAVQHIATQ
ncbi:MAG: S41 family peptidase [Chloroflexota bacterium]